MHPKRRLAFGVFGLLVLVAGLTSAPAVAVQEEHQKLWASEYPPPWPITNSRATALVLSPDDSKVFVTGELEHMNGNQRSESRNDYGTLAYASDTGERLWVAVFDGGGESSASKYDKATALAVSPDGSRVFVTGGKPFLLTTSATVAYDAETGTELWVARESETSAATAIATSPDGSMVFVVAPRRTMAYAANTGEKRWVVAGGSSMAISPDGSKVYVTAQSNWTLITRAYSALTGAQLWASVRENECGSRFMPPHMAASRSDSKIFVTMCRRAPGTTTGDYETFAFSAETGAELWATTFDGGHKDHPAAIASSPDGATVFVTGTSFQLVAPFCICPRYATVAYSAETGTLRWIAHQNELLGNDRTPSSMAVAPDGSRIFVAGSYFGTVAYSAEDGHELWFTYFDPDDRNNAGLATAIAVSRDGARGFVTGHAWDSSSANTYLTISFRTTSCANGLDERGPASSLLHRFAEPADAVHWANCNVLAPSGA